MIKNITTKRPIYVELDGDKARIEKGDRAFIREDGGKEYETKMEVGNDTLFDIVLHGDEITEKQYFK